eukprot:203514-Rhodomonas_salina.1
MCADSTCTGMLCGWEKDSECSGLARQPVRDQSVKLYQQSLSICTETKKKPLQTAPGRSHRDLPPPRDVAPLPTVRSARGSGARAVESLKQILSACTPFPQPMGCCAG